MTVAIKVENLSKKYIIKHEKKSGNYETFSDTLIQGSKNITNKIRHPFSGSNTNPETQEEFWALKDINFEINQGDKVGIIGRNGAGKSTLLKILSRITEPTSGKIHINGRIASLLEVGTGFHPELTGRENIYLNGAILGMSRKEIKAKFDEIVAFAEADKFLDTPVKRYSSGMYVRLAFAVAAHLEPEILVVDEVLAVGDAQFQKKCLGKMEEIGSHGRTILFVSHNLTAIESFCDVGINIEKGGINFYGKVEIALKNYIDLLSENVKNIKISERKDRAGDGNIKITDFLIENESKLKTSMFEVNSKFLFKITYESINKPHNARIVIGVYDTTGNGIVRLDSDITGGLPIFISEHGQIQCVTENIPLAPGRYSVNIAFFSNGIIQDHLIGVDYIYIQNSDYFNTGHIFNEHDAKLMKFLVKHNWNVL
ncbi:MAG: ABC transporter ATP-binding protein [Methylococcaceae bacterium]|nr:ABC transporter ATP-binding protein [Methylococcaceae bacterium]